MHLTICFAKEIQVGYVQKVCGTIHAKSIIPPLYEKKRRARYHALALQVGLFVSSYRPHDLYADFEV